ncbi:MAG TPA: TlyA family RNA methyltransferase [Acidimicrobiales bacterium]|nr:TlyA family RNA methyltransferase [Acidimicrobiales bacterium]
MSNRSRQRLDLELVRRGLAGNRQQAQAAVAAGRVLVGGAVADKPARLVAPSDPVVVQGDGPRFVSRGGEKLAAALDRFGVAVDGVTALDAGASTGGFTDCLLQRGASRVVAVDVGYGQLDSRLRVDPRVVLLERTNLRALTPGVVSARGGGGGPVDLVTADLSFISLTVVAPILAGPVIRPGGQLVLLVKPQFEAGRAEVSRGKGIIRDPGIWADALRSVASSLGAAGAAIMGAMRSPVLGSAGNTEFLLHAVAGGGRRADDLVDELVAEAVAGAAGPGGGEAADPADGVAGVGAAEAGGGEDG